MNMNECASYDSYYDYHYEPDYNYYTDYSYTDSDYTHDFTCEPTDYNMPTDDPPFDEHQPQAAIANYAQQDFQKGPTSQKPR